MPSDTISTESKIKLAITQAVREVKPQVIGLTMPNGGVVLAAHQTGELEYGREYTVLAMVPGTFQPFVVWKRFVGVQQVANGGYSKLDYCFSGDYHADISEAVAAYGTRA
jgi:hypothetical protein